MSRRALLGALAIGALAAAATDALLALAGVASFAGPPLAVVAAPLVVVLLDPRLRATVLGRSGLLVVGAAWTLVPLAEQHVIGTVVIDGALAELIHHTAGWSALIASSVPALTVQETAR